MQIDNTVNSNKVLCTRERIRLAPFLFGPDPEIFLRAHGPEPKQFPCTRERFQVDPIRDKCIFDLGKEGEVRVSLNL